MSSTSAAGPHCEYTDAGTCSGQGAALDDGSCDCDYDPITQDCSISLSVFLLLILGVTLLALILCRAWGRHRTRAPAAGLSSAWGAHGHVLRVAEGAAL